MTIDPQLRNLNIDLPACPGTLVKLSLLMADEHCAIDPLAALIETDMALASAVVRTVNSALFGLLKRVETVHEAVRYLGMSQVAGLTYEIGLRGAFPPSPSLQSPFDQVERVLLSALTRDLSAGTPLQAMDVRRALLVQQGRMAVLNVGQNQGFQISVRVEVLQDGYMGDQVRLRNPESGRTLTGIVTGLNTLKGI